MNAKITVAMPIEILKQLRAIVPKGRRSDFIVRAIKKDLELAQDYIDSNNDLERLKTIEEWSVLDGEGLENE